MNNKLGNEKQYKQAMFSIEKFLEKATANGFNILSESEKEELSRLSVRAEQYEDSILQIMPLPTKMHLILIA